MRTEKRWIAATVFGVLVLVGLGLTVWRTGLWEFNDKDDTDALVGVAIGAAVLIAMGVVGYLAHDGARTADAAEDQPSGEPSS